MQRVSIGSGKDITLFKIDRNVFAVVCDTLIDITSLSSGADRSRFVLAA